MVEEAGAFGFHSNMMDDGSGLRPINVTHLVHVLPVLKQMGVPYSLQGQSVEVCLIVDAHRRKADQLRGDRMVRRREKKMQRQWSPSFSKKTQR